MKKCLLAVIAALLLTINLHSQVRIGGGTDPTLGAILDLNSTTKGGLLLSNVHITNLDSIPANATVFPGIIAGSAEADKNLPLTGMIVYNENPTIGEGLYIWDGDKWEKVASGGSVVIIGKPTNCDPFPADGTCINEYTVSDPSCEDSGVFSFTWINGGDYIDQLNILDAGAGLFTVKFLENDRASSRQAILLVTSPCGNSNTIVLTQLGNTTGCDTPATAPKILAQNTFNLCIGGAVYMYLQNRPAGNYIWTLNGEEVGRGTEYIATRAGRYIVYANKIGCTVYRPDTATVTGSSTYAPDPVHILVNTNNGVACGMGGTVKLITTPPLSGTIYWYKDGVKQNDPIKYNGKKEIDADKGVWHAVVEDTGCSSILSEAAVVTEDPTGNPVTTPQLKINGVTADWSFCRGGSVFLEVANYNSQYIYIWYANNTQIGEGTGVYYLVPDLESVVIRCRATGNGCAAEAYVNQTINQTQAPGIPAIGGPSVLCGGTATLTANTSVPSPTYTWYLNGSVISGQTGPSLIATVTGNYTVTVASGGCTSQQSAVKTVTLSDYTTLTWIQNPTTVDQGTIRTYEVSATNPPVTYEWEVTGNATLKNGQGTNQIQVEFSNEGSASIIVKAFNQCGQATNSGAANPITVSSTCPQPVAQTPATDQAIEQLVGTTVTFTAGFTNTSSPSYKWFKGGTQQLSNGGNITGATTNSLTITPLTLGDAGVYTCEVTNGCSSIKTAISKKFTLTVMSNPATMPLGKGTLSGRVCFDIAETQNGTECGELSSRLSNRANFASLSAADKTYTFTAGEDISGPVRFVVVDLEGCVVSSSYNPVTSLLQGASTTLTVNYKTTLNSASSNPLIQQRSRNQAAVVMVYAVYDNGVTEVSVPLTIKIQDCMCCGAKISPSVWKAFMCHNLGADESLNPLAPDIRLMGAYYQWGDQFPAAYAPHISDSKTTNWHNYIIGNDWTDDVKSGTDPCPPGWRVPTKAEWTGVKANNIFTAIGPWNAGNKISGHRVGTMLFLPASGVHSVNNFEVVQRGTYGIYWSSTGYGWSATIGTYPSAYSFSFFSAGNSPDLPVYNRYTGINVRCISE